MSREIDPTSPHCLKSTSLMATLSASKVSVGKGSKVSVIRKVNFSGLLSYSAVLVCFLLIQ